MSIKHLILTFLLFTCSTVEETSTSNYIEPNHSYTAYEQSCIALLNNARVINGLKPLILHNGLSELAMGHVIYLSSNKLINHNNYGVRLYTSRDMGFKTLSENVAYGYTNIDSLISAWLKSGGHRDNLLNVVHTHHGFAIGIDSDGKYYYVHIFSH